MKLIFDATHAIQVVLAAAVTVCAIGYVHAPVVSVAVIAIYAAPP
jgi:hypothetical protein